MIIKAIENCDDDDDNEIDIAEGTDEFGTQGTGTSAGGNKKMRNRFLWDHLSCQIIYFVLYQFTSFSYIVTSVLQKVFF